MKKLLIKISLFFGIILFTTGSFGQNEKDQITSDYRSESFVELNINYSSDAVFMGRKDALSAPYLYPSVTYHHKSGFYGKGSFSYLTKSNESTIDLYLITAGFDFEAEKFLGDISFTNYFFNNDSYNVISEVIFDISVNLKYDFNIINLALIASNYFSDNSNSDFFLSSEISHDFITTNNKFQFSPTAGIYFGSQNFYAEYYIVKRVRFGSGSGHGSGGGNTSTTEVAIQESNNFNLMAIEFSLPMWYSENSFTVSFLPAFVLPQNEVTIIENSIVKKENLKDTFYWILGVAYKFN